MSHDWRSPAEALDRTVRLIQADLFPTLTSTEIVAALTGTRVRIRADATTVASQAGQSAIVATVLLTSQLGALLELDFDADAEIVGCQAPLRAEGLLLEELANHSHKLIQDVVIGAHQGVDVEICLGDAVARGEDLALNVGADDWAMSLLPGRAAKTTPIVGSMPFGAVIAATAAAAEVFRTAMVKLERESGTQALGEWRVGVPAPISWSLPVVVPTTNLGGVDVVSAGAITNATMFVLYRLSGVRADMRIFDDDRVAESNQNRCAFFNYGNLGQPKPEVLAAAAPAGIVIEPHDHRADLANARGFLPWAPRVLSGVDSIPARWWVQAQQPTWHCVGATSHFEVVVSEHELDGPCAGCLHPRDESDDAPIPTASFVSTLAGVLQAYRLVAAASGAKPRRPTLAYPFALDAEEGIAEIGLSTRADCPVGCQASRRLS